MIIDLLDAVLEFRSPRSPLSANLSITHISSNSYVLAS